MPSKNTSSADNQQERLAMSFWVSGFTDGEGCFSVSVIKNKTTKTGKQIFPEFVITQGEKSLKSLEFIRDFLGCGNIFINKRYDNHNEDMYRYCVRSVKDLKSIIIPFFEEFSLKTHKKNDFLIFKKVVNKMFLKDHLNKKGWNEITSIISKMNRKKIRC